MHGNERDEEARQASRRNCGKDMNIIIPGVLQFVDVLTLGSTDTGATADDEEEDADVGDSEANIEEDRRESRGGNELDDSPRRRQRLQSINGSPS